MINKTTKYTRLINQWIVKWKDIDEALAFNGNDMTYINKMKWLYPNKKVIYGGITS